MSLFFLTFFTIYGGVHVYFFVRARTAFALGGGSAVLLALFLFVMAAAPAAVRSLERHGFPEGARLLAWPGYLWMGFLFLFFCTALVVDLYRLALFFYGHFGREGFLPFTLSDRGAFFLPVATAFCISIYGFFEALSIRTEHVTIATAKLPATTPRLRIVQLSDVHLGLIVREERLGGILAAVREAAPDLLVLTGDLLDGQPDGYAALAAMFRQIRPRLGKFAITGNHEYYVGVGEMEDFCRAGGLTLLRGEGVSAGGVVNVAGVDDPAGARAGLTHRVAEGELLRGLPAGAFTLLLKHRPVVAAEARGLFDLQLSGHVHKGQIFPFNIVTHFFYPVKMGLSAAGSGSSLYVNRGAGTWGAPIRFLAPPEVTVIDLVRGL